MNDEPQDLFEQSVLTDKVQPERRDFSQRLVEYLSLIVQARKDLKENRIEDANQKLKVAAEISSIFLLAR